MYAVFARMPFFIKGIHANQLTTSALQRFGERNEIKQKSFLKDHVQSCAANKPCLQHKTNLFALQNEWFCSTNKASF